MVAVAQTSPRQKWHDRYPELGTGPISIEPYVSRAYFEKERERIFSKVWLNIGRVEQIPRPGDYFVKDLAVCHTSVLVVRGKDGTLRAFHNMCSHRGNQLVWDQKGTCQAFTCKFHGWVYGLDGALRHITDEDNFFALKKETLGMTPVSVATWEGFIFINVDPNPRQTLAEYLGAELRESIAGYPFAGVSDNCFSWHTDVNANWKVAKDAFQEVYHISTLHRRIIGNVFASKDNPYANALDFTLFPPHGRISLSANPDRQPTPVESLAQRFGSVVLQQNNTEAEKLPKGVNPTRYANWSFDGLALFPNCLIYVSNGTYLTHIFWPFAENRTRWEIRTYSPKARTLAERFSQEYGKVSFRDTLLEDGSTLERTQTMLASGAKKEIVLQDEELLIRQHHYVTETYLNS
ncbi:MAG: aromatic ring-hydroxylating dioxygenase subunit alpha [Deltaproteobacteria bacterium]|nr:aromatic ring-hydroxylating dioxygenase subunit alpha [Deltaproteobacteria bacterium]